MAREAKTLLVDDSSFMRGMMEEILNGFEVTDVTEAEDGLQGLSLFEKALQEGTPYSLVFLDIIMPVMDGQETLKKIRAVENAAGIKGNDRSTIIMVTSLNSPQDMLDAIIDGDCNDYLVKDFEPEQLLCLLTKYGFREET